MEFSIHTATLTQERIVQAFNNAVAELAFPLEDASSFVVHPINRLFRKIKGRFNPHDNVENAWFLVKMLLSLTEIDDQACISVFDASGNNESTNDREDFFAIHFPEQMHASNSRALLYRQRVVIVPNCVDELSAVLRCRNSNTDDSFTYIEWVDKPIALSLPQRIKLEKLPNNLARAILQVPELVPLACLVECGNLALARKMLTSPQEQQQVDLLVTVSRFSYAVLHHKANQQSKTMTELIVEGLAHLIEENDQYEENKSRYVDLEWFSSKPLRQLFLSPQNTITSEEVLEFVKCEADSDAWLHEEDDDEDDEAHTDDQAWTELERELNNTQEFDGVIHESTSKPVEFSSEEFFRILNTD